MKRIDSVNARPDENGLGKAGFNDNADLPQQDATYLSPSWLNMMQEELCNLLELRDISLDPESKRQLYDLLSTQTDLEALATEIENNFIRKNQIIDNLTTNDATKPVSAKQAKILQDEKLAISNLVNDLTSGGEETAITAEAVKLFYEIFSGGLSRFRIPDPLDPEKPWIIQFFNSAENTNNMQANFIQTFPVAFPNECRFVIGAQHHNVFVSQDSLGLVCATYARTKTSVGIIWDHVAANSAASTRSVSILAIGK